MVKESKKYSSDDERTLVAALVLHSRVLERVSSNMNGEKKPFRSQWSNLVAGWCFEHFRKFKKAPRSSIHSHFNHYAASSGNKETVETVETFLAGLSDEFSAKEMNEEFLVDLASRYFGKVRMERVLTEAQAALDRDDVSIAEEAIKGYNAISFGSEDWMNPLDPKTIVESLQEQDSQEVICFPGDLGLFLSPHFERDGFIAFVGPEKRGKSFWLLETVWQSVRQRRKTLYYVVGDMSKRQVMRRLACRATRHPIRPMKVERPIAIELDKEGKYDVTFRTVPYKEPPSLSKVIKALEGVSKKTGAATSRLKLKCCGGSSLSASDIERDVTAFARDGWIPDVVVVDYADLLAPEQQTSSWEYRHQINETWKILRRVSQDHHLLMVTATQAASSSYDSFLVKKKDFSEDKRKNAHVTGMLGINQTSDEKQQGVYRLNWLFLRDGKWTDNQVVHTAGCLALASPCIVSALRK